MSPKKSAIIIMPSIVFLIVMFFIPTNEFFGIGSSNEESPSPMMVLENNDYVMGLKITPGSCNETASGLTESRFQITNTHENDYEVILGVLFTDNEGVLFEKQVKVKILSGQTIEQIHLSDDAYNNPVCVVQIVDWF